MMLPSSINGEKQTSREVTCMILEMIDQGALDPTSVVEAALGYMSEDDVKRMAEVNELIIFEPLDEDDALDDFNYVGSKYHY
jgi:hypothetical protein